MKPKVILLFLIVLYLATRLTNLLILPIFTDESIYIYWAKIISETSAQYFISLTDGKPPLLIWLIVLALKILPANLYLLAGRLPVVLVGLIGMVGFYKLSKSFLESQDGAYISTFLYILSPFVLMYDRLTLFDGPLSAMLIWSIYFILEFVKKNTLINVLLSSFFLGLAFLFKPTAVLFLAVIPLILIFSKIKWQKIVLGSLVVFLISEGINNLLRISKVYYLLGAKNQQFQQPLDKFFADPLSLVGVNLQLITSTIFSYYTWPILALGFCAIIFLFIKDWRKGIIFIVLWACPLAAFALIAREFFPRYILFVTPYFFLPIGFLLSYFTKIKKVIALFLVAILILNFNYHTIFDPVYAPMPKVDYQQLVSQHPSGYGLDEVLSFLKKESDSGPITIVTQGTFGLYHYAFALEYWENPNVTIIPRWPLGVIDNDIFVAAQKSKVYVILKEHDKIPENLPLDLILKSEKPGGKYPILLTKLKNT